MNNSGRITQGGPPSGLNSRGPNTTAAAEPIASRRDGSRRFTLDEPRRQQTEHPNPALERLWLGTKQTLYAGATIAAGATLGPPAALAVSQLAQAATSSAAAGGIPGGPGGDEPDYLTRMKTIQDEGMANNANLFNMQAEIQDENRRFSSLSNVLRAKHDTTKAAVNNIRA